MSLFEDVYGAMTADEKAAYEASLADLELHSKQRDCPAGCGCVEFFDDRDSENMTGGFGVAGCDCARCNG